MQSDLEGSMPAHMIENDGVKIATEAFGNSDDPTVLLVMGAMASMLWWPEEFCRKLAARGRFVIRYDNRDTGLSTGYEPGKPPYTMEDMADDALRVLDGYGIPVAHLVGMSNGGSVAQRAALKHPDRVCTLTAISTSPIGVNTSHLPQTTEAYMEHAASGETVDWSDFTQAIDFIVRDTRAIAGTAYPYDEAAARALVESDAARARNYASMTNHFLLKGGAERHIGELKAPLLVIHGTVDPIFPVEHGEALARAVAGSKLLTLEGGGHEIHPGHWERIIEAIEAHTA
jgi:pimeloyl-ACP methyl ester carboxylesterase